MTANNDRTNSAPIDRTTSQLGAPRRDLLLTLGSFPKGRWISAEELRSMCSESQNRNLLYYLDSLMRWRLVEERSQRSTPESRYAYTRQWRLSNAGHAFVEAFREDDSETTRKVSSER
ncbi:hypothetical protein ACNS7O_18275 (plasmid) [Haloferacaceae archaeon DSL9]